MVAKGRSSSWAIKKVCQHVSHFSSKENLSYLGNWNPSDLNPSDALFRLASASLSTRLTTSPRSITNFVPLPCLEGRPSSKASSWTIQTHYRPRWIPAVQLTCLINQHLIGPIYLRILDLSLRLQPTSWKSSVLWKRALWVIILLLQIILICISGARSKTAKKLLCHLFPYFCHTLPHSMLCSHGSLLIDSSDTLSKLKTCYQGYFVWLGMRYKSSVEYKYPSLVVANYLVPTAISWVCLLSRKNGQKPIYYGLRYVFDNPSPSFHFIKRFFDVIVILFFILKYYSILQRRPKSFAHWRRRLYTFIDLMWGRFFNWSARSFSTLSCWLADGNRINSSMYIWK